MSNDWVVPKASWLSWRQPTASPRTGGHVLRGPGRRGPPPACATWKTCLACPASPFALKAPLQDGCGCRGLLPHSASGSHGRPLPDVRAPPCPVAVASSGLVLLLGLAATLALLFFPSPALGKFSVFPGPHGIRRITEASACPSWPRRDLCLPAF